MTVPITYSCSKCKAVKAYTEFYNNRALSSGIDHYCKECRRARNAIYNASRIKSTPSTTASDMSDAEADYPQAEAGRGVRDSLYVMSYDFDPCHSMGLKIGRAVDVEARALQLGASHNFRMIVLAIFPGLGHIEPQVHSVLSPSRASNGRGREWFNVSMDSALHAIAAVVRGRD